MTVADFTRLTDFYEQSLPQATRKANGIFYTDLVLAQKIVAELNIPKDATVLDPCCGTGSFNYAAISNGIKNVYGVDIDKSAISFCWSMLPDGNFVHLDSIQNSGKSTLSKLNISDKADFIIGNPPYARWVPSKSVSSAFNAKVQKSGNNMFTAAMIRAMELVKASGTVSYIIPKNFLHVSTYSNLRKEILRKKTLISIIDIGAYFKSVKGEQIIITFRNSIPATDSSFSIKKLVNGKFQHRLTVRQSEVDDEILLFANNVDRQIYHRLSSLETLDAVCTGYIGRGRSKAADAISGKEIRKFGYKYTPLPTEGNQIFIQNIYSSESGIIASFGGNMEAKETVTVLTDGNQEVCTFILGILHSSICNFFLYRYCYNYSRLTMHTDARYLKKIPMPPVTAAQRDSIIAVVRMLEQVPYMSPDWFSRLNELDDLVYQAFNLDESEQEFIKSEMKCVLSKKWSDGIK